MKFKKKLLQGVLIKRYKRFFVDIEYQNTNITAHCPNSGSMMGLLNKGNVVLFSLSKVTFFTSRKHFSLSLLSKKSNLVPSENLDSVLI